MDVRNVLIQISVIQTSYVMRPQTLFPVIGLCIVMELKILSILSIFFSYLQYRDMQKINEFATSILIGVPLSLTFFLPFILNRWLKMNFIMTFSSALLCLAISYGIHHLILRRA